MMNKLSGILLISLTLIGLIACNNSALNERVQLANGVSVLMPKQYKKNELSEGDIFLRARIGSNDLRVFSVKDMSMENLSQEELLQGLEINVTRFLEPMKGKLIQRKDTIIHQIVTSNFEFEMGEGEASKHGLGRFILKSNRFVCFMFVAKKSEFESNKKLMDTFFNSIQIE